MAWITLLLETCPKIFVSFGAMCLMCGAAFSISQAKHYQMELAEYKLAVGSTLSNVKKVSNSLAQVSDSPIISRQEKQEIKELTQKTEDFIELAETEIQEETEKLTQLEE